MMHDGILRATVETQECTMLMQPENAFRLVSSVKVLSSRRMGHCVQAQGTDTGP